MIARCSYCGKQAVSYHVDRTDRFCTIRKGSVASGTSGEVICGYCASELNDNGMFPEERLQND